MQKLFLGMVLIMLQFFTWNAKANDASPILVELFTSEGCSSCPPAEKFLNELSNYSDIVAVAYHVTYWDYLGWEDKFASNWGTNRQKLYARFLQSRTVYTPQMIIDGRHHETGSKRDIISDLIVVRQRDKNRVDIEIAKTANTQSQYQYQVTISKENLTRKPPNKFQIVAVYFIAPQETQVQAGENRGLTLNHSHIAKKIEVLGEWNGKKDITEYSFTRPDDKSIVGVAVFAQAKPVGIVIGSNKFYF